MGIFQSRGEVGVALVALLLAPAANFGVILLLMAGDAHGRGGLYLTIGLVANIAVLIALAWRLNVHAAWVVAAVVVDAMMTVAFCFVALAVIAITHPNAFS